MNTHSEDNLLDQSLRDVFRDYDLPPDAHPRVWEGVAERIATMPAPSTGLSYRFLLPLTAIVGMGIGWLLPHPNAQQAPTVAAPAARAVLYAPAAPAAPTATLLASSTEASLSEAQPVQQAAATPQQDTRRRLVATRPQPVATRKPVSPAALDSASTAAVQAAITPEVVVQADSAPTAVAMPAPAVPLPPAATPQASAQPQQYAPATKSVKPTGTNEKIAYRKLSQRQPEGRRGIGRWFTRFFQGVRHLLS